MVNYRTISLTLVCIFTLYSGISHAGSTGIIDSSHDLSRGSTGAQFKYATNQACVFCHTPHGANTNVKTDSFWDEGEGVYNSGTGTPLLLWNRSLINSNTDSYKLYSSSTSVAVTTVRVYSLLCLSCHDGVGALNVLQNYPSDAIDRNSVGQIDWYKWTDPFKPNQIGDVFDSQINIGERTPGGGDLFVELRNDHPISVFYNTAKAQDPSGFNDSITVGGVTYVGDPKVKLFGGYVECTSCHDPHNEGEPSTGFKYPFLWVDNASSYLCTRCHNK